MQTKGGGKGRIPPAFLNELLARTDIVELIDSYVPLKKAGSIHKALCPFHDEKTPSFTVNATKQFFHCFGCGASGNAISFLMEYSRMDFLSAVDELSSMAGLEIPREQGHAAQPALTHLYDIMAWCAQFYQEQCNASPQALQYLQQRGLQADMIERFSIGYAPSGWDALIKQSQQPSGLRYLEQNGLIIKKTQGGFYDRFRHRVMFPIRDPRGRVIAFGGRVLDDATPKYLNSPETAIFSKSHVLYGLYEARRWMKDANALLVVEGYMDVVALAQHGVHHVVATLGTAITAHHIKRLYQTTQNIVFSFDGDAAGEKAAFKAMTIVLPFIQEGRQANFLLMPKGEDPDTLVRKIGRDAFLQTVSEALPLSEFLFQQLSVGVDLENIDGKAQLVEKAKPLLQQMQDGVYKKMVVQRLEQLTGLEKRALVAATPKKFAPSSRWRNTNQSDLQTSLVRTAIILLLQYPKLAEHANPHQLETLQLPGMGVLVGMLRLLHDQPDLNTAMLLEKSRDTEHAARLHALASTPLSIPESGVEEEFIGAIARLLEKNQAQRLDYLIAKGDRQPLTEDEKSELNALLLA